MKQCQGCFQFFDPRTYVPLGYYRHPDCAYCGSSYCGACAHSRKANRVCACCQNWINLECVPCQLYGLQHESWKCDSCKRYICRKFECALVAEAFSFVNEFEIAWNVTLTCRLCGSFCHGCNAFTSTDQVKREILTSCRKCKWQYCQHCAESFSYQGICQRCHKESLRKWYASLCRGEGKQAKNESCAHCGLTSLDLDICANYQCGQLYCLKCKSESNLLYCKKCIVDPKKPIPINPSTGLKITQTKPLSSLKAPNRDIPSLT